MQPYYDAPTGFFGKSMWQDSAAYIWQSPVIMTDRIQTPLLMLHNKEDMITPFAQSIELFTAMRRLGKRCWLLQYDNEQHTLMQRENQQDFTIRLEQFYNHYLKGMDAPNWMTRGVAAKDKGIISGLEIDKEIKTPPAEGLLKMDGGQ
jgi:dipeptidyl aminopeptidase/acylaminoacyl peptidase